MKRHLIVLCTLSLLAAAGLGASHTIIRSEEQVALTEQPLVGDLSAVHQLSAELNASYRDQLRWQTRWTPEAPPVTETTLLPRFIVEAVHDAGADWQPAIDPQFSYLREVVSGGLSEDQREGGHSIVDELDLSDPIDRQLYQLAKETPAGESRQLTLPLKELTDVYTLDFYFLSVGKHPSPVPPAEVTAAVEAGFHQAFQYPVTPEHQVTLTTTRNKTGDLIAYSVTDAKRHDDAAPVCTAYQLATPEYLYFLLELRTRDGRSLDQSLTPGSGLYRLPHDRDVLSMDELELLCPLTEDFRVLDFTLLREDTELVLVTREKGDLFLRTLDAVTGQAQPPIPLWGEDAGWWTLMTGEEFLLPMNADGSFRLYRRDAQGQYHFSFSGTLPEALNPNALRLTTAALEGSGTNHQLSIAGERLGDEDTGLNSCGFALAVYDQAGLVYAGTFDSSLDQGETDLPDCRLDWYGLSLFWNREGTL